MIDVLKRRAFIWVVGLSCTLGACTSVGPGKLFQPQSPHDKYAQSLRDAKLERTALGIEWLTAASRALKDSIIIHAPYRESGYFSADKPFAVGFRLDGERGDKFMIRVDVQGRQSVQVFIDVFELNEQRQDPDPLISAQINTNPGNEPQVVLDVRRNRTHLIRIQPELLRSGRYTISITREPILSFPVQGRDSRQISSFFGASRDAGKRRHEGIDIFAPRGTPAVAAIDGVISGVGVNHLGGNVVWLSDAKHNQSLYYAHLDRQAVQQGQAVSIGDTVGFVGNTGNARTTGPHLHFGIYRFNEGAVDPLPYVRRGTGPARQTLVAPESLGDSVRIATTRAVVRQAPNGNATILRELPRSSAMTIIGGTAAWLRVQLPNGVQGYVASDVTEPARRPLRRLPLGSTTELLEAADPQAAVVETLSPGTVVDVLGIFGTYQLVRSGAGLLGWLSRVPQTVSKQ